ncbi:MAG: NifB/NifX family molybdenum-iron cluster-binding protein [Phycisphaerae bacterium]
MRIAIPQWQGRVSPVFDAASNLLLIDFEDGREVRRREVTLTATDPVKRAEQVVQFPPDVLICGAISWPLELALRSAGVRVVSQICGQVDEVMRSFLLGDIENDHFRMPGCCGRRRFRERRGKGCTRSEKKAPPPGGRRKCARENHEEI